MLLQTTTNKAVSEGVLEAKRFDIKFNAKMAGILSDGLYSYKIRAIIRELSTNAVDSHVAAGHTKPFNVHLPSWGSPNFFIRDYGVGLSKDQVINIFSVYGASNKEESNDFVGCLGLGSKSPFSYHTRTFTVESFYEGNRYLYNCFRDEEGMPSIALQYEGTTKEPNGVKITIPVSNSDIYEFQRECAYVYKYFKIKPKITGQPVDVEEPEYSIKGEGWGYRGFGEANVIMGNVCYPVKITLPNCQSILTNGFDIFAKIGEVDIQPSREGLSYNPETKAFLVNKCQKIIADLSKVVNDRIEKAKTLWEACKQYNNLHDVLDSELHQCLDLTKILWQGKRLPVDIHGQISVKDYIGKDDDEYVRSMFANGTRISTRDTTTITPDDKNQIICNDLKIGGIARAKNWISDNRKKVLLFRLEKFNQIVSDLGIPKEDIIYASTLPEPSRTYGGGSRGKFSRIVRLSESLPGQKTKCWENTTIDLDDGGIYLPFAHYDTKGADGNTIPPYYLERMFTKLVEIGIKRPTIYGVKVKDIAELPDGWTNYWDWVKEKLSEIKLEHNYKQCTHFQDQLGSMPCNNHYTNFAKLQGPLFEDLREKVKIAQKGVKELDKIQKLRYISEQWQLPIDTDGKVENVGITKIVKDIHARYPMLDIVQVDNSTVKKVEDYINLVEKSYEVAR